ncbi:MAG: HEAT repeat domain-containing protein [Cyanophyceae cyanobacterium]
MIFYRSPLMFALCVTCLGLISSFERHAGQATTLAAPKTLLLEVAQARPDAFERRIEEGNEALEQQDYQTAIERFEQALSLRPDSESAQQSLRTAQSFAYDQYMNAGYEATRQKEYQSALENFQQALAVRPDDLYAQQAIRNIQNYQERGEVSGNRFWWIVGAAAVVVGVGLFFLVKRLSQPELATEQDESVPQLGSSEARGLQALEQATEGTQRVHMVQEPAESRAPKAPDSSVPLQQTTRLPNLDIVSELIKDLEELDPRRRRKSIWELAQRGDSRAVKPLVAVMTDADSHERSLILAALSQICVRTLKPINQALAISLQDENAQVRKNAIRDSTKIYDLMLQVRQLLRHASEDPDKEVRDTAQWALKQLEMKQKPMAEQQLTLQPEQAHASESSNSIHSSAES